MILATVPQGSFQYYTFQSCQHEPLHVNPRQYDVMIHVLRGVHMNTDGCDGTKFLYTNKFYICNYHKLIMKTKNE